MDRLYKGRLCLSKIDQSRIFTSNETGQQWVDVSIIILEKQDKFGNDVVIQQTGYRGNAHINLGNAINKGGITFKFPPTRKMPTKMDSHVERDTTEREY